ncbi:hypothetical protein HPB47_001418 [Ixodes persulcatus]|uniref:Uncharacterized protein n=1 Tax=Ixodes persulcatus TaxID=34615 RepID=A0AC60PP30_IXOPE|nr:hypothetical protein HPB47_001418 [Ixodes persulcatus]
MDDRQRADRPSVEKNGMEVDPQEERRIIHPKKRIHSDACSDSADELDTDKAGEPSDDDERQDHEADGNAPWSTVSYKKPKPAKGTRIERFDLPKTVIVLKPREQIRITDISPKLLLDQIRAVLIVPCNRDRLSNVVNPRNNTIAVTVYDERHASYIMQLKALVTDDGRIVEVCANRSVTGTMPRGVIHGMKPETTAQDIVDNSDSDYHNIIHARPIGKKGTFLLTFDGEGIPRKISYHTRLINVYTYRPTAVICLKCHGFGHKAAVCTGQQRCKKCGKTHPEEEQCGDTYCVNCQVSGHTALDGSCVAKKNADTRLQKRAKAPLTQTKKVATPPRTSETGQGRTNWNRFLPLQNLEEFPPIGQLSQGTPDKQTHQQSLQTKGELTRPHKSQEVNSSKLTEEQLNEMCKELDEIRRRLIEKERRIEAMRVRIEKRKQEEERLRQQRQAELEEKRQANSSVDMKRNNDRNRGRRFLSSRHSSKNEYRNR